MRDKKRDSKRENRQHANGEIERHRRLKDERIDWETFRKLGILNMNIYLMGFATPSFDCYIHLQHIYDLLLMIEV